MTSRLLRVSFLVAGSGCCALIYQVVWMRELRLVFGASTAANAAVTAVFMGGLGLGSAFLGKRADSRRQPMMMYAGLEFIIAGMALVSPFLISAARYLYAAAGGTMSMGLAGGTVARLVLSTVILGGATIAMGGTLPAVVRSMETAEDENRNRMALLYGMNTAGAVIGVLAATFWMIEAFGQWNSLNIAAIVNLLIALTAWLIARGMPAALPARPATADGAAHRGNGGRNERLSAGFIYMSAFITGFVFFLMELVWYRMLSPLLGGTTYSFGLILAMALAGIGIGGGLYARIGRASGGLIVFSLTCGIEAVFLAVPYLIGDWVAVFAALVQPLTVFGLMGQALSWALVTMVVVLPAAIAAGYQFPLLIALLGRGATDIGRHTGNAYAFNTAGAIVGALAGGFGLMTVLSAPGCWRLAVIMMLTLAVAAAWMGRRRQGPVRVGATVLVAATVAGLLLTVSGPTAAWRQSPIGAGRLTLVGKRPNEIRSWMAKARRDLLWEMDGKESAIGLDRADGYAFVINGKIDGNVVTDAATQVMAGLVGAAIHPEPKRSLVIGLGTGSTAGWLARVKSMAHVDVVEIEPGIKVVAERCAPANQDVLNNPKVALIFADAREVLMTTDQHYDLIFSEPSNPYRAGIASLYTLEFYREAAKRLSPGGIFTQWVQSYEVAPRTIKSIYVTLASVFPYIQTWEAGRNDMLLVCSKTPMHMDGAVLAKRLAEEPFHSAQRDTWGTTGLEGFLSRYVANADFARQFSRSSQPERWLNTDDRMLIEFDFARTVGSDQSFPLVEIKSLAQKMGENRPAMTAAVVDWDRVQGDALIAQMLASGSAAVPVMPPPGQMDRVEAYGWLLQKKWRPLADLVLSGRFEPQSLRDRVVAALALATAGDGRALTECAMIARDRRIDAEAVATVFYWATSDSVKTLTHLENTLRRLQIDPWANRYALQMALEIAPLLANSDKNAVESLVTLLKQPFCVGMLTEYRHRLLLRVASRGGYAEGVEALAQVEPDVPWEEPLLSYRRKAYKATGSPLLAQAEQDLVRFQKNAPKPVALYLESAKQNGSPAQEDDGDELR